jgi:quinol monooxygenase YgiN
MDVGQGRVEGLNEAPEHSHITDKREYTMQVANAGTFRFGVDRPNHLLDAIKGHVDVMRRAPGNISYTFAEDVGEPGCFRMFALWESEEAWRTQHERPSHELRELFEPLLQERELLRLNVADTITYGLA